MRVNLFLKIFLPISIVFIFFGFAVLKLDYLNKDIGLMQKDLILIIFGSLIILLAIVSLIFHFFIIKPLDAIKELINKIKGGNIRERINLRNNDEIGFLAENFNEMLDNIEKTNQILKEEQGEIKAVISSIGEGLYALDARYNVLFMNKMAEKLLDISAEEAKGKNITEFITVLKDKKELSRSEWPSVKMLKTGKIININANDNLYYKTASGKIFPVEIITAPFARNEERGVIVIFKDISETKSREEEKEYSRVNLENALKSIYIERDNVQEEKNKLKAILNSIGEAVLAIDKEKKTIIFNKAAEKITGFDFSEIKSKPYYDFLKFIEAAEDQDRSDFVDILRLEEKKYRLDNLSLLTKEKNLISVDINSAPIKDPEGKYMGYIVVFRDVTEKRETERMRSDFVSLVSHQLRTPLASTKWFLEILLGGDVGKLKLKQAEVVKEAYDNNHNMIDFINQMLNVSRLESNRLALVPVLLNANEAVKSIIDETMPIIESKKQKLKFIGLEDNSLKIRTDKNLLRNIINSLITNASKYSHNGGNICVEMERRKSDSLLFKISDNGIGIPKKEQVKIFKKFSRASNAINYEASGTGLGLYIVNSILKLIGGKIWFESEEGQGTVFFFILPIDSIYCEVNKNSARKTIS